MSAIITCTELADRLQADRQAVLIDVLPPEEYDCCHLPGAVNACVYEVAFLQRVGELVGNLTAPLVVYDATGTTLAAATAREKLLVAGYSDVRVLIGGLSGWSAAGYPLAGDGLKPLPLLRDGSYCLAPDRSVLEWIGRNLNNRHCGRIAFAGGELAIAGGMLTGGSMTLNMQSISNLDLQDEGYRRMLVAHLRSEDFFAVDRYPLATISLKGWQQLAGATPGNANYTVSGELTIKDVTRTLFFPATVAPQEDGSIKAQAAFDLDRTLWNAGYGSGRLFERLGMHLVSDLITIELFIVVS